MACYTRWLTLPTLFGVFLYVVQLLGLSIAGPLVPIFSLFIAIWSTVFLEVWQREALELAHRWGVLKYEDEENVRFAFQGEQRLHPSTGQPEVFYPHWRRWLTRVFTVPVLLLYVVGCVALMIYYFSALQLSLSAVATRTVGDSNAFSPLWFGFLIPILDVIYVRLARNFTDWENYPTESSYFRHTILKVRCARRSCHAWTCIES